MSQGTILILVGAAGVGKDSITTELERRTGFRKFPSGTTRPMRPGESQGKPYTFYSKEEYEQLRRNGGLYNDIVVGGFAYGLQRDALHEAYERGDRIVLHFVHEEAMKLRAIYPNTLIVLIKAPSVGEQRRRLVEGRGQSKEAAEQRMADKHVQNPSEQGCDLVLINETDRLEETVSQLVGFLEARLLK